MSPARHVSHGEKRQNDRQSRGSTGASLERKKGKTLVKNTRKKNQSSKGSTGASLSPSTATVAGVRASRLYMEQEKTGKRNRHQRGSTGTFLKREKEKITRPKRNNSRKRNNSLVMEEDPSALGLSL